MAQRAIPQWKIVQELGEMKNLDSFAFVQPRRKSPFLQAEMRREQQIAEWIMNQVQARKGDQLRTTSYTST
jgi:hypothetical protein